jgi:uncharacterized repeat protein (TIGR01451 family)
VHRNAAALTALLLLPASLAAQTSADLSLTKVDTPDPVGAGAALVYTITASNKGPDSADSATVEDPLPAGTTFQSLASPAGWSCTTPAVGATGTVSCSATSFDPGSAVFTLTVVVDPGTANGTVLSNTAAIASESVDPNPGAETATANTTVVASTTVIAITKTDTPDPVVAGDDLTYTLTASNNGPDGLESATVSDTLPAGTTFVSFDNPAGWTCSAPAAGSTGTVSCNAAPFAPGDAVFTLVVHVSAGQTGPTTLANQARLEVTDSGRSTSQVATATTQVLSPAAVSGTKTVSGAFAPGTMVTYTVVLTNGSVNGQGDNPGPELTDVLPSDLVLTDATATAGTAEANPATNTVTWDGGLSPGGSVSLTIHALVGAAPAGTTVANQGTISYDADGDGTNEASAVTDDPGTAASTDPTTFTVQQQAILEVPALDGRGMAVLVSLLAAAGGWALRKRRA